MVGKSPKKRAAPRARRRTPQKSPVTEVLYDRVTGRTEEATILPAEPPPSRMTIRLRTDQRARLDQVARKLARTAGESVSVAAVVRGVLDALMSVDLDLAGCRNEADIKAAVLARLAHRR